VPSTLQAQTDEWRQCLLEERAGTHTLHLEAGPEKTDTVVVMVGAVVADLEDHEVVTAVAAAVPWVLLLHLEIGDAVRGRVRMVAEAVAASEVEEVVTRELLHDLNALLAT
jgi:hypothetical protein